MKYLKDTDTMKINISGVVIAQDENNPVFIEKKLKFSVYYIHSVIL